MLEYKNTSVSFSINKTDEKSFELFMQKKKEAEELTKEIINKFNSPYETIKK